MPQFDFSTYGSQIFWLILTFGFLYLLVSRLIAPKIETILSVRMNIMEDNIMSAERSTMEADMLRQQKQEYVDSLNEELNVMQQQALHALQEFYEKQQQKLLKEMKVISDQALKDMEDDASKFYSTEKRHCLDLAVFIIKRITNKNVTSEKLHAYL